MKWSWQVAKILVNSCGWDIEDMGDTLNKLLERKCLFFRRLRVIMDTECSEMPLIMEAREEVLKDEDVDEDADEDKYTSVLSWNETPQPPTRPCSLTPPPIITPILPSNLTRRQPSLVPRSKSSTSRSQSSTPRSESSTPRPSSSTSTPSSSTPSLPKHSEKCDLANIMKRAFEERQASHDEFSLKKLKADTVTTGSGTGLRRYPRGGIVARLCRICYLSYARSLLRESRRVCKRQRTFTQLWIIDYVWTMHRFDTEGHNT